MVNRPSNRANRGGKSNYDFMAQCEDGASQSNSSPEQPANNEQDNGTEWPSTHENELNLPNLTPLAAVLPTTPERPTNIDPALPHYVDSNGLLTPPSRSSSVPSGLGINFSAMHSQTFRGATCNNALDNAEFPPLPSPIAEIPSPGLLSISTPTEIHSEIHSNLATGQTWAQIFTPPACTTPTVPDILQNMPFGHHVSGGNCENIAPLGAGERRAGSGVFRPFDAKNLQHIHQHTDSAVGFEQKAPVTSELQNPQKCLDIEPNELPRNLSYDTNSPYLAGEKQQQAIPKHVSPQVSKARQDPWTGPSMALSRGTSQKRRKPVGMKHDFELNQNFHFPKLSMSLSAPEGKLPADNHSEQFESHTSGLGDVCSLEAENLSQNSGASCSPREAQMSGALVNVTEATHDPQQHIDQASKPSLPQRIRRGIRKSTSRLELSGREFLRRRQSRASISDAVEDMPTQLGDNKTVLSHQSMQGNEDGITNRNIRERYGAESHENTWILRSTRRVYSQFKVWTRPPAWKIFRTTDPSEQFWQPGDYNTTTNPVNQESQETRESDIIRSSPLVEASIPSQQNAVDTNAPGPGDLQISTSHDSNPASKITTPRSKGVFSRKRKEPRERTNRFDRFSRDNAMV